MLITRKRKVGAIGSHSVYGIDDISYVYIPPVSPKAQTPDLTDEAKYLFVVTIAGTSFELH